MIKFRRWSVPAIVAAIIVMEPAHGQLTRMNDGQFSLLINDLYHNTLSESSIPDTALIDEWVYAGFPRFVPSALSLEARNSRKFDLWMTALGFKHMVLFHWRGSTKLAARKEQIENSVTAHIKSILRDTDSPVRLKLAAAQVLYSTDSESQRDAIYLLAITEANLLWNEQLNSRSKQVDDSTPFAFLDEPEIIPHSVSQDTVHHLSKFLQEWKETKSALDLLALLEEVYVGNDMVAAIDKFLANEKGGYASFVNFPTGRTAERRTVGLDIDSVFLPNKSFSATVYISEYDLYDGFRSNQVASLFTEELQTLYQNLYHGIVNELEIGPPLDSRMVKRLRLLTSRLIQIRLTSHASISLGGYGLVVTRCTAHPRSLLNDPLLEDMTRRLNRLEHDSPVFLNHLVIDRPAMFDEVSRTAQEWSKAN